MPKIISPKLYVHVLKSDRLGKSLVCDEFYFIILQRSSSKENDIWLFLCVTLVMPFHCIRDGEWKFNLLLAALQIEKKWARLLANALSV